MDRTSAAAHTSSFFMVRTESGRGFSGIRRSRRDPLHSAQSTKSGWP
nr:MAG TPA: hypothetical protein [Caudoviricetes sp.]